MNLIPSSVYRLQLHEEFPLKKAVELIPYLIELGIEGIYCSPIFESISPHGYDIVNPNQINSLIGTYEEWDQFCCLCQQNELSLILDIVPNHMSIKGEKNVWWKDVLEKGMKSEYAGYYDINWLRKAMKDTIFPNKLLLPILDSTYGYALENQKIQFVEEEGRYWIRYFDYKLPVTDVPEGIVPEEINGKKGDPASFDPLHQLLEKQHYRLAFWRVAGDEINYRRFFNINELVAIHIESEKVFKEHHALIASLVQTGKVQGLRIDHPDGLYDPVQYFERIRAMGTPLVVVEKILDADEKLPAGWQVDGTVGYEFLGLINGLFIEKNNEPALNRIYQKFIGKQFDFKTLLYERKKQFITLNMASETTYLGSLLKNICEKNRFFRDFTQRELTQVLEEIIACFPVYRTYIRKDQVVDKRDKKFIVEAVEAAKQKIPYIDTSVFQTVQDILLLEYQGGDDPLDFVLRFQQITAPVMAKGLEDSLFYIYNRLISLNEVGCDPQNFGYNVQRFHQFNKEKLKMWPLGFLMTSTHDTKFSEDVRMRLSVLSEIPQVWEETVTRWSRDNQPLKDVVRGQPVPEANTEYYIYQMLVGLWEETRGLEFPKRFWNIIFKAIREAGLYTSWRNPNENYETTVKHFVDRILSIEAPSRFQTSLQEFSKEISNLGTKNSLSQLVLKMGSCGIVDIFQGNEYYHYAGMDPDNRTAVDYQQPQDQKFLITKKALAFRKKNKRLFLEGEYYPLNAGKHAVAFMRVFEKKIVVVAVERFFTTLNHDEARELSLDDTFKIGPLIDIFTGREFKKQPIRLQELFTYFPVAMLEGELS